MRTTLLALAFAATALFVVQSMAEEKKLDFPTLKDAMMCMKGTTAAAGKALEEKDMETLAAKGKMLAKVAQYAKKKFCTSMDFAMGCDMVKEAAEKMAKAAETKNVDDAKEMLKCLKNSCMKCHQKCRK